MTSQLFSSMNRFETGLISGMREAAGRPVTASEVYAKAVDTISGAIKKGDLTRALVSDVRLAIKLSPYSTEAPTLLKIRNKTLKALLEPKMPGLFEIIRTCRDKGLPLPLIMSCEKYMPAALVLQKQFRERYFSIPPVIVRGDMSLTEERYESFVLSLPVADTYEALPVKVFEAYALIQALDERCGVLKIDDDLTLAPDFAPDLQQVASLFASADYIGVPVHNIFMDRLWHFGKCDSPTSAVYGKPIKTMWGRGALYYLSPAALEKLTQHYVRFPGCLDGERYEDKAVGDILYDNGIILMQYILERLLGLESGAQERI